VQGEHVLSATVPFEWGHDQTKAFTDLKAAVMSAPVLQPFRTNAKHLVMADASSVGLGAILLEADTHDDLFRPVAFHSRKLSPAERNYPTREQELLALVDSLKHWRHYLLGAPFEIKTDHKSLEYLHSHIVFRQEIEHSARLRRVFFFVLGPDQHIIDKAARISAQWGAQPCSLPAILRGT